MQTNPPFAGELNNNPGQFPFAKPNVAYVVVIERRGGLPPIRATFPPHELMSAKILHSEAKKTFEEVSARGAAARGLKSFAVMGDGEVTIEKMDISMVSFEVHQIQQ